MLRKDKIAKALVQSFDADYCTTSVNVFELWHGRKKGEVINELLSSLKTLNLDSAASRKAGDILRVLQAEGNILDLKDLFIGAICIAQGAKLMTFNKKHFQKLGKFGLEII